MSHDPYATFADRYDLFYGAFDDHDPQLVAFFQRLVEEHQIDRVLDCACGTGRHLHLLHTLGCDVAGSDISPSMLAQARLNLAVQGLVLPLYQVDYRELPEHFRRFDAVVCLSSSILHMPDENQVLRALKSMRAVLRRGGILVLTQGTTDRQWAEKPRFIPVVNTHDFTRLFVIDYLGEGADYHVLDIWHSEERRDFQVWTVTYPRIYLRDDQDRLLRAAGFTAVNFYGSYAFEAYDKQTSQRLIAVARK
jgi:glycine/sarcosine N-methyltransferase